MSRLRSAPLTVDEPCATARAARTSARLVWDFDPGTVTVAWTGVAVDGASQVESQAPFFPVADSATNVACRDFFGTMGDMCGRFAVTTDPALLAEKIKAIDEATSAEKDPPSANFNVAPTTTVSTVVKRHTDPDDESTRRVRLMRWGLVPPWAKTAEDGGPDTKGPLLINARSEKVATSPAFRSSAKAKRCLVPMDGWYEWQGQKGAKTPFYMYAGDGEPLFMAGLWSTWRPKEASKDARPLFELHDHHDGLGRRARRHPRPDATDHQRARLGPLASTLTPRSTRGCCAATATWTASRSARSRGW